MTARRPKSPPMPKMLRRAVRAGAALPLLATLSAPVVLAADANTAEPVAMAITDDGCKPDSFSVPPGKSTFKISNESRKLVTWTILKGEVALNNETVVPGSAHSFAVTLEPGTYQVVCGSPDNRKGTLTVGTGGEAAKATPSEEGHPHAE